MCIFPPLLCTLPWRHTLCKSVWHNVSHIDTCVCFKVCFSSVYTLYVTPWRHMCVYMCTHRHTLWTHSVYMTYKHTQVCVKYICKYVFKMCLYEVLCVSVCLHTLCMCVCQCLNTHIVYTQCYVFPHTYTCYMGVFPHILTYCITVCFVQHYTCIVSHSMYAHV